MKKKQILVSSAHNTEYDRHPLTFVRLHKVFFSKYGARHKIISLTIKRLLKTQDFERKATLQMKKIRPFLSRFIEYDKPQRKIYKRLEAILTFIVEGLRSFLRDIRSSLKHNFL